MRTLNEISTELKDLNLELPWLNMPSMSLPNDYFESLSDELVDQIHTEDFLATLPKSMPQELPPHFFEHNIEQLAHAVFIDQLPKQELNEVPIGYFEHFAEDLSTTLFIDQLPKSQPQIIPSSYFDQFHDQLMQDVKAETKPSKVLLQVTSRRINPMAIAASILFMLGMGFFLLQQTKPLSIEQQVATLSTAEIEQYIQTHQAEFDTDLSIEYIDPNQIDILQLENEILNNQLELLSEEEIEAYLL